MFPMPQLLILMLHVEAMVLAKHQRYACKSLNRSC